MTKAMAVDYLLELKVCHPDAPLRIVRVVSKSKQYVARFDPNRFETTSGILRELYGVESIGATELLDLILPNQNDGILVEAWRAIQQKNDTIASLQNTMVDAMKNFAKELGLKPKEVVPYHRVRRTLVSKK